jgi:hypothetical protein
VVEPRPAQARVEAGLRGVVAVVADPQLGGDEDLVAVDAGAADALADLALVVVGGGRVDQPVAVPQRGLDGGLGLLGRAPEDAEAEAGMETPLLNVRAGVVAGVILWSSRRECSLQWPRRGRGCGRRRG